MGPAELFAIIILLIFSLLCSLLVYFGMHPARRIQLLFVRFVRLTQLYPPIIILLLLILIVVNLLVISFRVGYFPGMLTGAMSVITAFLIAILIIFARRVTIKKEDPSMHIQLLAVMTSGFHRVTDFVSGTKIGVLDYGPPLHWMQTALDTYGISFIPVIVYKGELFEVLKSGVVDAVLITEHTSPPLDEPFALGKLRLLPWSIEAVEAVTRAFPTVTRPAVLPLKTYVGQSKDIKGYASY